LLPHTAVCVRRQRRGKRRRRRRKGARRRRRGDGETVAKCLRFKLGGGGMGVGGAHALGGQGGTWRRLPHRENFIQRQEKVQERERTRRKKKDGGGGGVTLWEEGRQEEVQERERTAKKKKDVHGSRFKKACNVKMACKGFKKACTSS
jgi:hypothetical protein